MSLPSKNILTTSLLISLAAVLLLGIFLYAQVLWQTYKTTTVSDTSTTTEVRDEVTDEYIQQALEAVRPSASSTTTAADVELALDAVRPTTTVTSNEAIAGALQQVREVDGPEIPLD